jgi:hypothetical protein
VLEQARITQPSEHRRLNAFENRITSEALAPAAPAGARPRARMSDETREALLAWIEAEESGQGHTLTRLAVYAARVTDNAVPEG